MVYRPRPSRVVVVALAILLSGAAGGAQAAPAPVNDAPNPYKVVEGWAKLPGERAWGSTSAVAIAPDGKGVWVAERCGANNCVGSPLPAVYLFDATGKAVKSFGAGLILSPHGIDVDRDGNVWVTDCACTLGRSAQPANPPAGHQIFKFSPDGKLLMTLGKAGGGGATATDSGFFYQPNDVLVAPNGDIFVSEGHSSEEGAHARILKFDRTGKFLKSIGRRGKGRGEFDQPHALAMDSKGRLFVGDRSNNRIQILDQDGNYLEEWTQFSRPSGIAIDRDDNIYVADSESGSVNPAHGDWKRGIRIGSAKDGSLRWFIPDPAVNPPNTSAAEGVAVDRAGNVYGAEVGQRGVKKYTRIPNP
jgi:sugar lactone lactonase YvrE